MSARAKFKCDSVKVFSPDGSGQRSYEFSAVTDSSTPENERFSRYTPYGTFMLNVDNPAVEFVVGKSYYLDITEAQE